MSDAETIADDVLATVTLRISYLKPNPGESTSLVQVDALDSSIPLACDPIGGLPRDIVRVWGAAEGERIGAELHRRILDAACLMLEPWTDAAETLQVAYARAHLGKVKS